MDLIPEHERSSLFASLTASMKEATLPLKMTAFATSIWDETLYKAWYEREKGVRECRLF